MDYSLVDFGIRAVYLSGLIDTQVLEIRPEKTVRVVQININTDTLEEIAQYGKSLSDSTRPSNLCSTLKIDEQQLQKAIEISKTQKLSIHDESEACESNKLREVIDKISREDSLSGTVDRDPFFLDIQILKAIELDFYFSLYDALMAICWFIRHILALIRHLIGIKGISDIVQALHRIFYIPHSFIHGPGNTDDDHSNSFHSITARMFSSRKGNVLLASGLG